MEVFHQKPPAPRGRAGFTLLEICLVVAIILIVALVAVPSVHGLFAEQRLHRTFEAFDAFVTKAQLRAVRERRAVALVWGEEEIALVPLEKLGENEEPEHFPIAKNVEYSVERPGALLEHPPAVWTFWRSGACEPVVVTYRGPEGMWKVKFDPLTARRTFLEENPS